MRSCGRTGGFIRGGQECACTGKGPYEGTEGAVYKSGRGAWPESTLAGTLTVRFLAPRTEKFLLFKPPILVFYGSLSRLIQYCSAKILYL